MIPIVLSGGSGTRLWPISREKYPKQLAILLEEPLLVSTLRRLQGESPAIVVTNETLKSLTESKIRQAGLPAAEILAEPFGRNTTAAFALACRFLQLKMQAHEVVGVFSADHSVRNETAFRTAVTRAEQLAEAGKTVIIGIQPDHPATGFGYIHRDLQSGAVKKFIEKPPLETARSMAEDPAYSWNAGIFIFKVETMIALLQQLCPDVWRPFANSDLSPDSLQKLYATIPSISIDYAVMEKMSPQQLSCVPMDAGWDDVGSWESVSRLRDHNEIHPQIIDNGSGNFVHSSDKEKVYALVGCEDLVVVDTADALLICKKGQGQDVRKVVEELQKRGLPQAAEHSFDERPWGSYEILLDTPDFKSKKMSVNPGQQLSYQSHKQREEHWIITTGQGEVVLDDVVHPVRRGSYIKIPLGAKHRIRNNGTEVLDFIEVQIGSYFGEDDITRYQDDYRRS